MKRIFILFFVFCSGLLFAGANDPLTQGHFDTIWRDVPFYVENIRGDIQSVRDDISEESYHRDAFENLRFNSIDTDLDNLILSLSTARGQISSVKSAVDSLQPKDYTSVLSSIDSKLDYLDSTDYSTYLSTIQSTLQGLNNKTKDYSTVLSSIQSLVSDILNIDFATYLDSYLTSFENLALIHQDGIEANDYLDKINDSLQSIDSNIVDRDYSGSLSSIISAIQGLDINDYTSVLSSMDSSLTSIDSKSKDYSSFLSSIDSKLDSLSAGGDSETVQDIKEFLEGDLFTCLRNFTRNADLHTFSSKVPEFRFGCSVLRNNGTTKLNGSYGYYTVNNFYDASLKYFDKIVEFLWNVNENTVDGFLSVNTRLDSFTDSFSEYSEGVTSKLDQLITLLTPSDDDGSGSEGGSTALDSVLEKVTSLDDNFKTLFQAAFSVSDIDYADISFASNSVSTEETVELSINDFFSQCLNLIHAGVKVSASETRFLKHILERMPNLSEKDTSDDEDELSGNLDDVTSSIDSLKESFDLELTFKEDVEDYFDYSAIKNELDDVSLPSYIEIRIPEFMGINEQVLNVSVSPWQPFLTVSRQCFGIFYWCLIGSFVFFAFRLFLPLAMKFAGLVGKVLYW